MDWSPQQHQALEKVAAWFKSYQASGKGQVFRVFGYAGTGKTTLARHFAEQTGGLVRFAAFTGKAALMMERSGCHGASTIHSLLYNARTRKDGSVKFALDKEGPASDADLIVIDECSMVDEAIGTDLLSFGKPVLVLGDPAQLPPVKGAGFFTGCEPDVMLTEIHRQAEGNPIIQLATQVRTGGTLQVGDYGAARIVQRGVLQPNELLAADQIIVGRNLTRRTFNQRLRTMRGATGLGPVKGDRLVCLRNDRHLGIFNGGLFAVASVLKTKEATPELLRLKVTNDDFPGLPALKVEVRREFFEGGVEQLDWRELKGTQHFDYGYALTAHKSQGSQWPEVIVYDESRAFRDEAKRWLYTAITRASDRLTLVVD